MKQIKKQVDQVLKNNIEKQYDQMIENRPYVAATYDTKVKSTIPYVSEIYLQTADVIRQYCSNCGKLLDIGFGTAVLERILSASFPELQMDGIEISDDMIRFAEQQGIPHTEFRKGSSLDMQYENEYDLVTALMSHHFYNSAQRKTAVGNVYRALKQEGLFICFENVKSKDDFVLNRELNRWEAFQIKHGKTEAEAAQHKQRCGTFYFPITVKEHISLLREIGFRHVYVFWRSYMQMGILAVK